MLDREIDNIELHLSSKGYTLSGPKPKDAMWPVWKEGKRLLRKKAKASQKKNTKKVVGVAKKKNRKRDRFYQSEEWRSVRYKALELSDGACCLCGRSRKHGIVLHVDHIKPRSIYPTLEVDLNNLQVLCDDCNLGKSNKSTRDWRQQPSK